MKKKLSLDKELISARLVTTTLDGGDDGLREPPFPGGNTGDGEMMTVNGPGDIEMLFGFPKAWLASLLRVATFHL